MLISSVGYLQDVMVTIFLIHQHIKSYRVSTRAEDDVRQFLFWKDTNPDVLILCRNIKKYNWMIVLNFWMLLTKNPHYESPKSHVLHHFSILT